MFLPISDYDEPPNYRVVDDRGEDDAADAETGALAPFRGRGISSTVLRVVPGPRPFTWVSQESNFNAYSSSSAYYSPYSYYPPTYSAAAAYSPPFMRDVREAREVSDVREVKEIRDVRGATPFRSSYVAVEDVDRRDPPALVRYESHRGMESRHSYLQELHDEEERHEERPVSPRQESDDDATIIIEVGDDEDEKRVVRGPPLAQVDISTLSSEQVLFYFGVLKLQEKRHLQPTFEYTEEPEGRWSAKLTMYNDSLRLPSMSSLVVAKVEICRLALSILKVRHGGWKVPDEPNADLTPQDWRWFSLLQEYVDEMHLPAPESSRYVHRKGFRYEIVVGTVAGLGKRKFYTSEDQAVAAAAHQVLYLLITGEVREFSNVSSSHDRLTVSPGTPAPAPGNRVTNAMPTIPTGPAPRPTGTFTNASRPNATRSHASRSRAHRVNAYRSNTITVPRQGTPNKVAKPQAGISKRSQDRQKGFMSNLLPVVNPRISTDAVQIEPEPTRKWNIAPGCISNELIKLATYRQKFESEYSYTDKQAIHD
jgi:hypothetical protein